MINFISALLVNKHNRDVKKKLKENPELAKQMEEQRAKVQDAHSELEKQAKEDAANFAKNHPEKLPALRKYYAKFGIKI